jgi:hypothetical protein
MFSKPVLGTGQQFPELPHDNPRWRALLDTVEVQLEASKDPLETLTRHAIGWVEDHPQYTPEWHTEPVASSTHAAQFQEAGFVDPIDPHVQYADYVLVDGGYRNRYKVRLSGLRAAEASGQIRTPHLTVFGGQCLRAAKIDSAGTLNDIADSFQGKVDAHTERWLAAERSKSDVNPNRWQRPYATERELGRLSLHADYGDVLYTGVRMRERALSIDPSIPTPHVAADVFRHNDGKEVLLLNAPAKIREHAGRKKPIDEARPTGRSCFYEWLKIVAPPRNSSVLLYTNAPNIYRSWLDVVLRAREAGRSDLRITAAGAGLEENQTMGNLLTALGDLIVNFYNYEREGGIDSPDVEPFAL